MSNLLECQKSLIEKENRAGYLTFDDIIDASEQYSLSAADVDVLSEALQLRGVLIYEKSPTQDADGSAIDYTRTDYEELYSELLSVCPGLDRLIDSIKKNPPPQRGELDQLAYQIEEGNRFARNRLIAFYMRNVLKIALSMSKQYEFDLEEAISSGFIGLMTAADRYDPSGFSTFSSYAAMWIQQSIQRECNPVWMDYYFPAHYKEKMYRAYQGFYSIEGVNSLDCDDFDKEQTIEQIAESLGVNPSTVKRYLRRYYIQKYCKEYLDTIIESPDDNECFLPDSLVEPEEIVTSDVDEKDLARIVCEILETLSDKERIVVKRRFGLDGNAPATLEEIGSELGVTRERVRQIETKAIRKIRHPRNSSKLDGYINAEEERERFTKEGITVKFGRNEAAQEKPKKKQHRKKKRKTSRRPRP